MLLKEASRLLKENGVNPKIAKIKNSNIMGSKISYRIKETKREFTLTINPKDNSMLWLHMTDDNIHDIENCNECICFDKITPEDAVKEIIKFMEF